MGSVDENTPEDTSIINVSTGDNGKIRPNDFNTITVAVTDDGRILSIESNLRQIIASNLVTQAELLTPQEALDQFINHRSQLSLTIPSGAGSLDLNKVYPGNKAQAKQATITDYLLTYLEKPGQATQQALVPMYLIRGIAELSSSYRVRFTETVPALKNGLSFLAPLSGTVAGLSTQLAQAKSIQLGSFTPTPTLDKSPTLSTPPLIPTSSLPSPTSSPASPGTNDCDPTTLSPVFELPGVGRVGMAGYIYFFHNCY